MAVAVHVINNAPIEVNDTVLIVGGGVIGSMITQVARLRTSAQIIVTDVVNSRLELARKLGADVAINPSKKDVTGEVLQQTGGEGVDVSIEVVGVQGTIQQAQASVRRGGTVIAVGLLERNVEIDMMSLVSREIKLHGSYLYSGRDFRSAMSLIAKGKVNLEPYLASIFTLEDALIGFREMATNKENVLKVILRP